MQQFQTDIILCSLDVDNTCKVDEIAWLACWLKYITVASDNWNWRSDLFSVATREAPTSELPPTLTAHYTLKTTGHYTLHTLLNTALNTAVWVQADWVQKSEMIVLLKVKTLLPSYITLKTWFIAVWTSFNAPYLEIMKKKQYKAVQRRSRLLN